MKISLIQTDIVWNSPLENQQRCREHAEEALKAGSSVLIFPEMFTCGFSMPTGATAKESFEVGHSILTNLATTNQVYAVGSLPELAPDGSLYNTASIVAPNGATHSYRKIHLFSYGDETKLYSSGSTMCTVPLKLDSGEVLRATVLICYDLRFAPLFLARAQSTDLFIIVANWPASRREHWLTLLRARAIETQSYVAGVNRVGTGGGLSYCGDSVVFAPDGSEVCRLGDTSGVLSCEVNPATVTSWRETFPALRDRRPTLYSQLVEG